MRGILGIDWRACHGLRAQFGVAISLRRLDRLRDLAHFQLDLGVLLVFLHGPRAVPIQQRLARVLDTVELGGLATEIVHRALPCDLIGFQVKRLNSFLLGTIALFECVVRRDLIWSFRLFSAVSCTGWLGCLCWGLRRCVFCCLLGRGLRWLGVFGRS